MKNGLEDSERNPLVTRLSYGIIFLLILFALFSVVSQTIQFYRTIHTLKTLSSHAIRELRIYPRSTGRREIFSPPSALIDKFFQALTDIRAYRGSPKGIMSLDHEWFVEIETADGHIIQMSCHLPANGKKVVHGALGRFYEKGGGPYYGEFQSQGLYHWYQQYSHLWLGEKKEDEEISIEFSP